MKHFRIPLTALALLLCLALELALPLRARAATRSVSDNCLDLIRRYEGFSGTAYQNGGKWYIGYGTQIKEGAYPDGVTEEEALELMRGTLRATEDRVNTYAQLRGVKLTQGQFDALVDFTYTLGTSWINGNSLVRKLTSREIELSRRETARAFGVWCHSGGEVLPRLAERRLEEAALYLDGDFERAYEYCYLAIERDADATCVTDFAVYDRGGLYDYFPQVFRLGWSIAGMETEDGTLLRLGDIAEENLHVKIIWEKSDYDWSFPDVPKGRWYYDYVMELSEAEVINGRTDGTYAPNLPTTTGEALKLILLAAGHELYLHARRTLFVHVAIVVPYLAHA